jgi:hypothetical protein
MSFQINNLSLITYGAIGITSIALAVITIFDGESSPAGTDSADMLKSFMPSAQEEVEASVPEEVEPSVEEVEASREEDAPVQEESVQEPSDQVESAQVESAQVESAQQVEPSAPPQPESNTMGGKKSKKTNKSRRSKAKQTKHRR